MRTVNALFLFVVTIAACDSKETQYDRRKPITLEPELAFKCIDSEYIAEINIKNALKVDIKINIHDVGVKMPPHQQSFIIEKVGRKNEEVRYNGKTVNKDGVDISDEILVIASGEVLNFNYNLSRYYEIYPTDNHSYLVKYEGGATSDRGPIVIFLDSKEYKINNVLCN